MTNVQDLRKIFSAQGIKGASSWNRAKFTAYVDSDHEMALALDDEFTEAKVAQEVQAAVAKPAPKKGICEDCGRKVGKSGHLTLCEACYDYAGWENTHSDNAHDTDTRAPKEEMDECPVCHPELDPRKAVKPGRSRAGMVIVAKGTELHKSETFRVAAEAAGWKLIGPHYIEDNDMYVATAIRGEDKIELVWNGRAYDYPNSGATINGKARKVRNLKEALRFLAA